MPAASGIALGGGPQPGGGERPGPRRRSCRDMRRQSSSFPLRPRCPQRVHDTHQIIITRRGQAPAQSRQFSSGGLQGGCVLQRQCLLQFCCRGSRRRQDAFSQRAANGRAFWRPCGGQQWRQAVGRRLRQQQWDQIDRTLFPIPLLSPQHVPVRRRIPTPRLSPLNFDWSNNQQVAHEAHFGFTADPGRKTFGL